ncbi:UPF0602 protein C4orf47 homolog [Vespa crabro]|uniref:UPF0602 protein C4orf47 homolog n=1 Tax=Vespa crabro TaxID=7445 RepID=UPI001EFF9B1D|nr:UPF0602 protein C4orf47 homolog [Vespa crabro]
MKRPGGFRKETEFGRRYGKADLDRVGFFDDIPNASEDPYGPPAVIREDVEKGRQLLSGPPYELFEKEFQRIFVGEALTKPISQIINIFEFYINYLCNHVMLMNALKFEVKYKKIKIVEGPPLIPPSPSKKHSTPGDSYGCFSKQPTYFSPVLRAKPKREREEPNFKIKPGKLERKGPSFLSMSAPLDYFPPNPYFDERPGPTYVRPKEIQEKIIDPGHIYVPFPKSPGGNHDGCFSKFPSYLSEPYDLSIPRVVTTGPPLLAGGPDLRTKYTNSIINQVTAVSCNAANYREYHERVYPLTQ